MTTYEQVTLQIDNLRAEIGSIQGQIQAAKDNEKAALQAQFNRLCDQLDSAEAELWEIYQATQGKSKS